jgi:hypothetical protein
VFGVPGKTPVYKRKLLKRDVDDFGWSVPNQHQQVEGLKPSPMSGLLGAWGHGGAVKKTTREAEHERSRARKGTREPRVDALLYSSFFGKFSVAWILCF